MRSQSSWKTALCGGRVLWMGAAFMTIAAFGSPVISVQPSPVTVAAGQTFSVNVTITGVTDLFAFQFDLGFDPTKLRALTVSEGPLLGSGGSSFFIPGTINNSAGILQATFDSLVGPIPGISGSGVLASFGFLALLPGQSSVTPARVSLLDSTLFDIPSTAQNGVVTATGIQATPEPSTLAVSAAAICLLAALAARRPRP